MTDLAALVAAAPGSLVLPAGDRRASVQVPEPLRLLDSCDLGSARYIGVVEDSEGGRWTVPLVVDASGVRRALPGDGVAEALVRGIADVRQMHRTHGPALTPEGAAVQGDRSFVADAWYAEDATGERGLTVDQTNESVVVGDRAMVKWAVHLPPGGVRGTYGICVSLLGTSPPSRSNSRARTDDEPRSSASANGGRASGVASAAIVAVSSRRPAPEPSIVAVVPVAGIGPAVLSYGKYWRFGKEPWWRN